MGPGNSIWKSVLFLGDLQQPPQGGWQPCFMHLATAELVAAKRRPQNPHWLLASHPLTWLAWHGVEFSPRRLVPPLVQFIERFLLIQLVSFLASVAREIISYACGLLPKVELSGTEIS